MAQGVPRRCGGEGVGTDLGEARFWRRPGGRSSEGNTFWRRCGEEMNLGSIREARSDPQESRSSEEGDEGAPLASGFRGEVGEEL